jgi:hypothetical protein
MKYITQSSSYSNHVLELGTDFLPIEIRNIMSIKSNVKRKSFDYFSLYLDSHQNLRALQAS